MAMQKRPFDEGKARFTRGSVECPCGFRVWLGFQCFWCWVFACSFLFFYFFLRFVSFLYTSCMLGVPTRFIKLL